MPGSDRPVAVTETTELRIGKLRLRVSRAAPPKVVGEEKPNPFAPRPGRGPGDEAREAACYLKSTREDLRCPGTRYLNPLRESSSDKQYYPKLTCLRRLSRGRLVTMVVTCEQ